MKEDILISLENRKQAKTWRNVSIILICAALMALFGKFNLKDESMPQGNIIAEIDINGMIVDDSYRDSRIQNIINDNNIKAVILNVDSPGGMVTPSEILYDLISQLNQKKPVVVLMGSMATSGAYMLSLGANHLIARNTTLTGSIGVIMQSYEVVELAKKLGVSLKTFKSSELKGMPSLYEVNTEASNAALQSSLDDIYDYFVNLVKTRRKMTPANLTTAINGQAFTGRQALKIGLVDEIGDKDSAIKYLESRGVNTKLPIINISLRRKINNNILNRFLNTLFSDFNFNSTGLAGDGLMSIYNGGI